MGVNPKLEAENHELKVRLQRQLKRRVGKNKENKEPLVQPEAAAISSRKHDASALERQSKRVQDLEAANATLQEQVKRYTTHTSGLLTGLLHHQVSRLTAPPLPSAGVTDSVAEVEQV